jgi:N-acetylmuramoyl-L-alanine amidase
MRATWLPDVLRDAGLTVRTVDGWENRGSELSAIYGIIGHHTASNKNSGNNPSLGICTNGRPDLAGPLCQCLLARDGSYDIIASGKANHAGDGGWPGWPSSGNSNTLAIEAENDGIGEWWSAAIMDSYAIGSAAILEFLGKDESAFITHFEWCNPPGRKIDPRGPWMQGGGGEDWWSGNYDVNDRSADAFRLRIGACMGMTAAQEQKLDKVITLLDNYFGIDAEGNAKDIRKKIDYSYVELADENHSDTLGGRLVVVEEKVDKILNIIANV